MRVSKESQEVGESEKDNRKAEKLLEREEIPKEEKSCIENAFLIPFFLTKKKIW